MRAIQKQREPNELTEYRLAPNASYDDCPKDEIREQLLGEQGHLCAYCMQRISSDFDENGEHLMKIEHWQSQSEHDDAQLDYRNMIGVCLGNKGQPPKNQTCDNKRGNHELKYNPANPAHRIESHIQYLGNGRIKSKDDAFDTQLNNVLNLNYHRLIKNRMAVVEEVLKALGKQSGTRTSTEIQRLIHTWCTADNAGKLKEYCGVAIYFLTKRLNRTR
jgi:uncharacterized protein (TIGR02646 family)